MRHELMDHERWEDELRAAALAICDLYNPSSAYMIRTGQTDPRFDHWISELRELAWKRGYRTRFAAESDRTED